MSIALLYERSENDENGIKLTAEQLDISLTYLPLRIIAIAIHKNCYTIKTKGKNYTDTIKDIAVVLNRAQSKNRRLYAAHTLELFDKKVINPSQIEFTCYSKLRTLLHFWKEGIPIPKTVYVPCDPYDMTRTGTRINNENDIADLLENEITSAEGIVIKPDAGTHGNKIVLSQNRDQLITNIQQTTPSITNPVGIIAQEQIKKWFYDLRIIVYKEKGKTPVCHPTALARAGFKDFRTNTYLGNLVFDAKLPLSITQLAVKCGKALGKTHEAWVFALDAMMNVGENKTADETQLKAELDKAAAAFETVQKVKADETRLKDFPAWNSKLEKAFHNFKSTESYAKIKNVIDESVDKNQHGIVFHEANSCPEFWEQTRLIAGINVAVPLIKSAQSMI
jgi:glutathione synthase/RimK-type ligase-like ATP-grasp enzyme